MVFSSQHRKRTSAAPSRRCASRKPASSAAFFTDLARVTAVAWPGNRGRWMREMFCSDCHGAYPSLQRSCTTFSSKPPGLALTRAPAALAACRHLAPPTLLAAPPPLCRCSSTTEQYVKVRPPTRASLLQQHISRRPAIGARFICGCRGRGAVGAARPLAAAGRARLGGGARSCLQRGVLEGVADLRLGSQQQGDVTASSANQECSLLQGVADRQLWRGQVC